MNALILAASVLYGTLNAQTNLVTAPSTVRFGDTIRVTAHLPEPTANRLGYKMVVDTPPVSDTNHYAVATGWAEKEVPIPLSTSTSTSTSNIIRIVRVYSILPLPPPPARRIYKYDLSAACIEYGEITNLVTFISADAGVKWMWDCAEILVEDDPYFITATNAVIQSGAISEAKVKAILDRAYELGQLSTAN